MAAIFFLHNTRGTCETYYPGVLLNMRIGMLFADDGFGNFVNVNVAALHYVLESSKDVT